MIKRFLQNIVKKEIDNKLISLHESLSNSFTHIKKDMAKRESHSNNIEKKLLELENKLHLLEMNSSIIETKGTDKGITSTQQKILITLHQLQKSIDQAISTKSLAKYIYAGRKYGAVRSTLSSYLEVLEENNLITKRKLGKESYSEVTDKGRKFIESLSKDSRKEVAKKVGG